MKTLIASLLVTMSFATSFAYAGGQSQGKPEAGQIVYLIGKNGQLVAYRVVAKPSSSGGATVKPTKPSTKPGAAGLDYPQSGKLDGKTDKPRALVVQSTTPIQVQQCSPTQVAPKSDPTQQFGHQQFGQE